MNESPSSPAGADDDHSPPPVVALREELTQTMTAANQLRSILATVDDPARRTGRIR